MKVKLSVVVITRNEAKFIGRCLRSAAWADERIVVDSGSSDETARIAEANGAKVIYNDWPGWPMQKNFGIDHASNDWVMCIDADEIITPTLAESIQQAMRADPDSRDGYHVERPNDMLGVLLANEARPSKQVGFVRVFNRTKNRFSEDQVVHEEIKPVGRALPLSGDLIHWRGYTMDEHISSYNRYATIESQVWGERGAKATPLIIFGKPVLRFLWCYFYKQGFKRGTPGLLHAMVKASWEFMWLAKVWERQNLGGAMLDPPNSVYSDPEFDHSQTSDHHATGSQTLQAEVSR
jgi:(heptosyl)LPS beta-1,4-glucosyltransferase